MCGICGIYDPAGDIRESELQRMTDLMSYRGPDKDGFHVDRRAGVGYRRLSIIDLETGDQPMTNEDGTVWVVLNGEIYNYLDLRRELASAGHAFVSRADTEVIVHGYEAWGTELLHRLNGMYAFLVWDAAKGRLFAARDRLGVKPLYYRQDGARITFASEIKCLLVDGTPPIEPEAVVDYLTFANCFGPKTFFRGISKLLPGHYLVAGDGRAEVRAYWDLRPERTVTDERAAVERYLALLEDAVGMELMADVPLGAHLSGGMDSSAVVIAARKRREAFDTFSAKFPELEFDETPYARKVAERVGSTYREVTVRPSVVPDLMPRILRHLDEPRAGPGVIPQFLVSELASRHVRVVLTGHGGDELFAGYPSYLAAYVSDAFRGGRPPGELLEAMRNLVPRIRSEGTKRVLGLPLYATMSRDLREYGREPTFPPQALRKILAPPIRDSMKAYDPRRWLDEHLRRSGAPDGLTRLQYLDVKTYLPSLLDNEDRASMAYSVEARVPLLDHRMAAFAASLAPDLRVRGLTLKYLPRRALASYLPEGIVDHKKMGFPVPIASWFRGDLASWIDRVLAEERIERAGLLVPSAVRPFVDAHTTGKADVADQLWALANLQLWAEQFGIRAA